MGNRRHPHDRERLASLQRDPGRARLLYIVVGIIVLVMLLTIVMVSPLQPG
jgi:hypothetical protein